MWMQYQEVHAFRFVFSVKADKSLTLLIFSVLSVFAQNSTETDFLYKIVQEPIICTEQYRDILFIQNSTETDFLYKIVQ